MVNQLANNKRARFVSSIDALTDEDKKPFDLIFITSDSSDLCFKQLRHVEARKLTRAGTGQFFN